MASNRHERDHHTHHRPTPGDSGDPVYDVVVVGGGAAGLSGAITLGRSRRTVLVLDAGEPRNSPAAGVHNVLGHEGIAPQDLLARGRAEATAYGVEQRAAQVSDVRRSSAVDAPAGFVVTTEDGAEVAARRVLVASGLVDALPDLPGLADHWGSQVLHCPYCHGWEVRDRAIAVLGTGPTAAHQALLFSQLSDDVALVLAEGVEITEEDLDLLGARHVLVVRDPPAAVESDRGRLVGLRLVSGARLARDVVVVAPTFRARTDFLTGVGLAAEDLLTGEHVLGSAVPAGRGGATSVPGVYVAGNATDLTAQVGASAAAGVQAGALINADLIQEEARTALDDLGAAFFERPGWEERYAATDAVWSGDVNAQLVTETSALPPGSALDVGSGEGADAIWLAGRGWEVTGLEFSSVARERAARHAAEAGVAHRTSWRDADLRDWDPGAERWDLVTAHYFHQPDGGMLDVVGRLAEAVAPGGTLLVVGHHPDDVGTGLRHGRRQWLFAAEDLLPALDPGHWEVVVAEARGRQGPAAGGDGSHPHPHTDAVLRARRRRAGSRARAS